jgi:hypothetical protein
VTVEQLCHGSRPRARAGPGDDTPSELCRRAEHDLWVVGCLTTSRAGFDAAYRAADAANQPTELARAALGLGGVWTNEHHSAATAAAVRMRQLHALRLVGRESAMGRRLSTRLTAESDYRAGRYLATVDALHAAAGRDPVEYAEAIGLAHHCLLGPDHAASRPALAEELLRTAARTGRRFDVLMGLFWRAADLFTAGDLRADRAISELRAALAATDHLAIRYAASGFEVSRAIRAGSFGLAERLAGEAASVGAAAGDEDVTSWLSGQLVAIRWYQGRLGELLPMLRQAVESPALSEVDVAHTAALAVAAAEADDRRQARCALARLGGRELPRLVRSSSWLVALHGVAGAVHRLLLPYGGLPMVASLGAACFGSTRHAQGVASLAVGQPDRAAAELREAVRANEALGHWPAAVLSRERLARALAAGGRAADADEVAELDAAVAAEAGRLGMRLTHRTADGVEAGGRAPLLFHRAGRRWRIQQGTTIADVDDCVGMRYLGALLDRPGTDIAATDLVAVGTRWSRPDDSTGGVRRGRNGEPGLRPGSAPQPVLDRAAASAYRTRLTRLDAELSEADTNHDLGRLARLRAERDWLLDELRRAAGLGGRTRSFTDEAERARTAVAKAIRRAIDRVGRVEPALANRLRAQVHTGVVCRFTPA